MQRLLLAFAVLLLGLAGISRAEPMPAADPLDALIQRSGLADQLVHFEAAMQRALTEEYEQRRTLPPEEIGRMRKAVANAYAPSSLRPALRAELARTLSKTEIAAALRWLESPTGRKLEALEEKASRPEEQRRLEAAAERGIPPLSAPRTQTLNALIKATRADEVAATILIETAVGIQEGFAESGPEVSRSMVKSMRRGMESERDKLAASLHARSFLTFALVYAEATDAELLALLGFARSPAGERYLAITSRAFASTLGLAAKRVGSSLVVPAAPAGI